MPGLPKALGFLPSITRRVGRKGRRKRRKEKRRWERRRGRRKRKWEEITDISVAGREHRVPG